MWAFYISSELKQLTVLGENGVHGDNVLHPVVVELEIETEQSLSRQCIMVTPV